MRSRPRLVAVANRLPVHRVGGSNPRWVTSPGGLVTAMAPILKKTAGAWVGWDGSTERRTAPFTHEGISIRPVGLTESEVEGFYNQFSNQTLWPLYHDAIRTPVFDR